MFITTSRVTFNEINNVLAPFSTRILRRKGLNTCKTVAIISVSPPSPLNAGKKDKTRKFRRLPTEVAIFARFRKERLSPRMGGEVICEQIRG